MDAILDRIDSALAVAGVTGDECDQYEAECVGDGDTQIESEIPEIYSLKVGDGCTPISNANRRGVIRSIVGGVATVEWLLGGETEEIEISKLDYMPTMERIYGESPDDPNGETFKIRAEWANAKNGEIREQRANNYPSPKVLPHSTRISDCAYPAARKGKGSDGASE